MECSACACVCGDLSQCGLFACTCALPRERVHELRRNDLRAAFAQDVMRADFGHARTGFRATLRAILAER